MHLRHVVIIERHDEVSKDAWRLRKCIYVVLTVYLSYSCAYSFKKKSHVVFPRWERLELTFSETDFIRSDSEHQRIFERITHNSSRTISLVVPFSVTAKPQTSWVHKFYRFYSLTLNTACNNLAVLTIS